MIDDLETHEAEAMTAVTAASSIDELDGLETTFLGRQAPLTVAKKEIASLPADRRKDAGRALNDARARVTAAIEERRNGLAVGELHSMLDRERLDTSPRCRPTSPWDGHTW